MEEEKKELKQEPAAEDEKKIHKKTKRKFLLLIPALIVLCVGLYFVLRETGVINKYVYEEVENLAEREEVSFDNLLFSYVMVIYRGGQRERRWLCIMNTGDVYAFEWNNELTPWDWYYDGTEKMDDNEPQLRGYNDANWGKMQNVVYLGKFSDSAVRRLNSYVENFDIYGEYYYSDPPQMDVPDGGGGQQERENVDEEDEEVELRVYGAWLFWHDPPEEYIAISKHDLIEWCRMNQTWWGGYEKEILERSLDENAIEAIKLFESSGFYDKWVRMCLNGY